MIQTSFQAANKRYTTKKSRSAGFNLWYLFMNVGAIASGVIIDVIRKGLGLPNSYIFLTGVLTAVICFFTALLMIRNNDQLGEEEKEEKSVTAAVAEKKTPLTIAREVVREPAFWRLMVFILFTLGVRAVFTYNYLLMPKYWLRTIGPDASIGVLQIINPIIIVAGLILLIPIVNKLNLFKSLVGGSAVSALSMLPMVLPWQLYSSNIATAHYLMAIACMVTLALGELFWSPRLNEYTAAVAPKGQEGTYLGLTMIPWFAAKTIVSLLSGHMLHRWSPEQVGVAAPDLVAKARETGLGAAGLADKIMPADLADKAQSLGTNILDLVRNVDPTAVMAQA
jgi:dipeptide/tripeptide permease